MSCLVDTGVLLQAAMRKTPEHRACYQLVQRLRNGTETWCLTWPILCEFRTFSTNPRIFGKPLKPSFAQGFLRSLFLSPSLRLLREQANHWELEDRMFESMAGLRGALFQNLHTVALMKVYRVDRIYTTDERFRRFPFLEVVDPRS